MNNSFGRLIDGMTATLRQEVLTRIDDEFARGQVFGVINLLNNFKLRADWSVNFLQEVVTAQTQAFHRIAEILREAGVTAEFGGERGVEFDAALSAELKAEAAAPIHAAAARGPLTDAKALLLRRDQGNRVIINWLRWIASQPPGVPAQTLIDIELTLRRAMRSEVEVELRHLGKPMFAEMSQGTENP
jgi:hypothetical protein